MLITNKKQILPYYAILNKSSIFNGVDAEDYSHVLQFFQAEIITYQKNEVIMNIGDSLIRSGFILKGAISGSFYNESDDEVNMNQFGQGSMFGEALVLGQVETSPVQIHAIKETEILFFDFTQLWKQPVKDDCCIQVSINLLKLLSKRNIFLNQKVRILSQHKLRDRIKVYLRNLPQNDKHEIHIPFSMTQLAEFLSVNRSALSREFGKMEDEKLLQVSKHTIQIIDDTFLDS